MSPFGILATCVLFWMWVAPHEFGRWIEMVKDPYRQRPIHQKRKGTSQ